MDGRMFRKVCVFGCLAAAGAGVGCKNSKSQQQSQVIGPMPADTQKIVNMPLNGTPNTKNLVLGRAENNSNKTANNTPNVNAPAATMPVEVVKAEGGREETPRRLRPSSPLPTSSGPRPSTRRPPPGARRRVARPGAQGYQKAATGAEE